MLSTCAKPTLGLATVYCDNTQNRRVFTLKLYFSLCSTREQRVIVSCSQTLAGRESLVNCPYKTCSNQGYITCTRNILSLFQHPPQLGWAIIAFTAIIVMCQVNEALLTMDKLQLSPKQCKLCGAQLLIAHPS